MIAIRNVTKEFDVNKQKVTALSDVNFTIEKGDIFGIIGFSGAGKSTLLRMINALEVPTSGHVEIDGVNINGLKFLMSLERFVSASVWFFNSSIC